MSNGATLLGLVQGRPNASLATVPGLRVTVGPLDASALSAINVARNDPAIAYFGGQPGPLGAGFPRENFSGAFDLTYADGRRDGIGGVVAFRTDASTFKVLTYGAGFLAQFDVLVDGVLVQGQPVTLPADGSVRFVSVDFSSAGFAPGFHDVELAYNGTGAVGGLQIPDGTSVRAVRDDEPRIVFLGDSFTEGTGAIDVAHGYDKLAGRYLGSSDTWTSGFGGTGYEATLGDRPGLVTRISADGVAAHGDIYVVAMGINDAEDSGTLRQSVRGTLATLVAGAPHARIFVLGPWNPGAPAGVVKPNVDAIIAGVAAEFANVVFLDPSAVPYTKADPTHPDQAGHETLAQWLTAQIRANLGADGYVEQNVAGDVVGPLFVAHEDAALTYSYAVLEGGAPSTHFQVVDHGDAFPVLKLLPGVALSTVGPVSVDVQVTSSAGQMTTQAVTFAVREHLVGSSGSDTLVGHGVGVSSEGGGGDDTLIGTVGTDVLSGGSGNDYLDGGAGADTLIGGTGDDNYVVDQAGDIVREQPGGGTDRVYTTLDQYVLPADVEQVVLLGPARDAGGNEAANLLVGNDGDNTLYGKGGGDVLAGGGGRDTLWGGEGNDFLDGGTGVDTLIGGTGDDGYAVDQAGDAIVEAPGEGRDTIYSTAASYTMPRFTEQLVLLAGALDGIGTIDSDIIVGNGQDNHLWGGDGNDFLDGQGGRDILAGGAGDDGYVVDRVDDVVQENAGEGHDAVYSTAAAFTLPDNVEELRLLDGGIAGTGNGADNVLAGNALDNRLVGLLGNDFLDGGAGRDTLVGGPGDDGYAVDRADDVVIEAPGEGRDTIFSSAATYTMPLNTELLVLVAGGVDGVGSSGGDVMVGNDLANHLSGGAGNDFLDGQGGRDTLTGGTGDDSFVVDRSDDVVQENAGEGTDTVYSSAATFTLPDFVERLDLAAGGIDGVGNRDDNVLVGNALANHLRGDAGNDVLVGGDGDDVLAGDDGSDYLDGGAGNDTATYAAGLANYLVTFDGAAVFVTDRANGDRDALINIEQLAFGAQQFRIDTNAHTLVPIA